MKYISIDIETTGLNEEYCQVLEIGAVIGDSCDTITSVIDLPCYCKRLYYDKIVGEPTALAMNAKILADMQSRRGPYLWLNPDTLWSDFCLWLEKNGFRDMKPTLTGKNFGTFDSRFLIKIPRRIRDRFSHQTLDVGSLYFDPYTDTQIPNTEECIRRANLDWDLAKLHSALEDARLVVELLRRADSYTKRRLSLMELYDDGV